jgi:hypothetical protein
MDKALKFALTISGIIIIFDFIIYAAGGVLDLTMVCILGVAFIVLTVFFWFAYILGRAMWNTEKKVWRWMNEEEK